MTDKEYRHTPDELLVQRFRSGDTEALTRLIRRFHPKLVRMIGYQIRDNGPAEDIAQECWYAIIKRLPDLDLRIGFHAWAASIARRKAIDWIRSQQRSRKRADELRHQSESGSTSDSVDETGERVEMVRDGIRQLPPTQRIVLEMFYLENLSLREIAGVLRISSGTVKSRLFYARENLRKLIDTQSED